MCHQTLKRVHGTKKVKHPRTGWNRVVNFTLLSLSPVLFETEGREGTETDLDVLE